MAVLRECWVLTLATTVPGEAAPYATPLFYAVVPGEQGDGPRLIFASRPDTTHGRHLAEGPTTVAAGLYLETESIAELRGVQLRGEVVPLPPTAVAARAAYLERHPGAAALLRPDARERLYALTVTWAKLTDNRLGFGYKHEWSFAAPTRDEHRPPVPV
ncbi:pyridoxamine 5'-phosphate oxidase family protein [Nannocystis sp.]|uniref:pyridoxamine 5'-phosphate oxidase family protein n=1 Tax=Nannocystis sp. TaxID=1962667 RepID=UPI0025F469E0|nr:pyridoxamine 5'-phosphate oxidase family protein [Nannocystis sp.]MBK7827294.1 pyridoxamine 5'-phosphate oxidase family protein [Nannocystis sp.]